MKRLLSTVAICALVLAGCQKSVETDKSEGSTPSEAQKATATVSVTPTKNAYFGDTHIHTKNSFDASILDTKTTADDAYRFAKGATIDNGAGKPIKLSGPPLDFYAVTDHGEYMGVVAGMRDRSTSISKTKTAKSVFGLMAGGMEKRRDAFMEIGTTIVTGEEIEDIYDREFIDSAWAENVTAAEKYNQPGVFTTFAAYEFTAMEIIGEVVDNSGALNLHRNVIFKDEAPTRLFTTLDSPNPEDLWEWMNEQRANGIEVLAIPHNSNGSNGQMFDTVMTDGSPITAAYAENRMLNEPIVEMAQVKGTSETHPLLSPNDEWADHELYEVLIGMAVESKKLPGSFVRQSLARGIDFDAKIGANPYQFGLIGASDTHVSAPALTEEDFFGKFSTDLDLEARGSVPPNGARNWDDVKKGEDILLSTSQYAASGLAGVWAESNTRGAIFDAMRAKETFSTSGPRIKVRMFASYDYTDDTLSAPDMLEQAYAGGVAMGQTVTPRETSPSFLAWAAKDANGESLQRLQMVKVWHAGGKAQEAIFDIACAGGAAINASTQRCADNGAKVDLSDCSTSADTGAGELKTLWQDPSYDASQNAAYYVRVLENPKCRWSTWDAVRNGTPPNPKMHATLQDRAWGSPIWMK